MSSKYNNENNKRSKSWKRSDEEMLQSTHLRVQLRKDSTKFGSNYNLLAENGSRSRIGPNVLNNGGGSGY